MTTESSNNLNSNKKFNVELLNILHKRRMESNRFYTKMYSKNFGVLNRYQGVKLTDYEKAALNR